MSTETDISDKRFFLPDFCHVQSVFFIVLVAELLAILLCLARFNLGQFWVNLGNYSLFIQWVALVSASILCGLRPTLRQYSDGIAGLISYLIILIVTFLAAILAQQIESYVDPANVGTDWDMVSYSMLLSAILSAFWLRLFYLQAQYRLRLQAETEAKLQALQARIKPHFLFNSMNILSSLIAIKPDLAEQVVEDLSALFRASLTEHKQLVSLKEEITICKSYLHIETLRLGDRLKVEWQIEGDLIGYRIPPLTLQPLIENAVYHGIQPLVDGGTITIAINTSGEKLKIGIINPFQADHSRHFEGHQVAVSNIRDRLELLFGQEIRFEREEGADTYRVIIELPAGDTSETANS